MKRALLAAGVAAAGSLAFAVEVSAHFNLEGNLANGGTGAATRFVEVNEQGQQDPDAAVVTVAGEKAGGEISFKWTYTSDSTDGQGTTSDTTVNAPTTTGTTSVSSRINDIAVRKASIWFKPTSWSKVTAGTLMQHLYREYMRFWEDASGSKVGSQKWMNYREGSGVDYNDSGAGIALAIMPTDSITIEGAVAPGTSSDSDDSSGAYWTWNGNHCDGYMPWGATAKWNITKDISVGAAYADNGMDKYKLLSVGFDYGNPFMSPLYFFIQPRFYFGDKNNSEIQGGGFSRNNAVEDYALTGLAFDNWFKVKAGDSITIMARVPFVLRMSDDDKTDPSYLLYDLELDYNMDSLTPYIEINNCNRIWAPLMFGSEDGYTVADSFAMDIRPGCKFNFDNVEVNVGVDVYFGPGLEKSAAATFFDNGATKVGWRIPFGVNITL